MLGEWTALRLSTLSSLPKILLAAAMLAMLSGCSVFTGQGEDGAEPLAASIADDVTPVSPTAEPQEQGVPGVSETAVTFGQSAAFSGAASSLGSNMRLGIEAAFHEVNEGGGVNGRLLRLNSLDDAYAPEKAVINTIQLIEELDVFALIGGIGTPTSRSAVPVAQDAGVPYIAPLTGAEFLRESSLENVLNLRSSYFQETEEMVERLTSDLGITRISILYQDDSFGRAGLQGVINATEKRNIELASIGLYQRLTTAVKAALLDIRRGDPQAVIIIGSYEPAAELILWTRHLGMDPVFMAVSFVGSNALAESLGPQGKNVFVTQVVPFPTDDQLPITSQYLQALERLPRSANPTPGFVSFEGYLAGRVAIEGLKRCGDDITRDCFLRSLRDGESIDLGGFTVQFAEGDNQGSDSVFMTRIDENGEFQPVTNLRDAFAQ